MPEIAKNMVLDYQAEKITVDGEEFPYHVAAEPIETRVEETGLSVVYLPVLVEGLEVLRRGEH